MKKAETHLIFVHFDLMYCIGVTGFEPAASWSRTKHSTKLSHTPMCQYSIPHPLPFVKGFLKFLPLKFVQSMNYFRPDFFVDVSESMEIVTKSLMHFQQNHAEGAYPSQSYEYKRTYRGRCGGVYKGEAFKIVKFPNGNDDFLLKQLLGSKFRWYGNGMYPAFGEDYF